MSYKMFSTCCALHSEYVTNFKAGLTIYGNTFTWGIGLGQSKHTSHNLNQLLNLLGELNWIQISF